MVHGKWTMDYGPWSIGLWSMVHFGHHFPGKIARRIGFLQYIGALWELISESSGSSGSSGNGVIGFGLGPPFYTVQSQDDGI